MEYRWLFVFVVLAGIVMVLRAFYSARKARREHQADWDAKLVRQLRARGLDPFKDHVVDFFFALPDEQACAAVNQQLEKDGFRVDVKATPENPEFPFSLHATKTMRVQVDDMRERSRRFGQLAAANRGRYDGWSSA